VLIVDLAAVTRSWDIKPTDFDVEGLAFSPDSRRVAAGLASGNVAIWQLRDDGPAGHPAGPRAEPRRLDLKLPDSEQQRAIVRMAFHPDGRRFAAVYPNGVIRLWNLDHPGNPESLDVSHGTWRIRGAAFSPDRRRLALGSIEGLLLLTEFWDANRTSRRIDTLETEEVAWRPDGRRLAAGASDGTIHIWDVTGESAIDKVRLPQQGAITTLAFSFDGRRLASVGEDQGRTLARLWTLDGSDLVTLACRSVPRWSLSADRCTNEPLKAACQVCQDTTER
jgi:WD40 repeat protein